MKSDNHLQDFVSAFRASLSDGSFIKMTLGAYHGTEKDLKNIYIRKITIKDEPLLAFTLRYQTKDIAKNYTPELAIAKINDAISEGWRSANLFTAQADFSLQLRKNGHMVYARSKPTQKSTADSGHNRDKQRHVSAASPYLHHLGITTKDGAIHKAMQDKYRQIDKYIDIVASLIKDHEADIKSIADMGSGKGYLTFALYDYLHRQGLYPAVTGVEYREDLVTFCNSVAASSGFKQLSFTQGSIQDYDATGTDLLIALHACDTATDDAIAKGIKAKSRMIVVAPCCHKQIRREMEKGTLAPDVSFLTEYGIFMERQAEMVTDGLRALMLQYMGYDTKVFEFISDAHTPKNVMITATLNPRRKVRDEKILIKIRDAMTFYGINTHYLQKLLEINP